MLRIRSLEVMDVRRLREIRLEIALVLRPEPVFHALQKSDFAGALARFGRRRRTGFRRALDRRSSTVVEPTRAAEIRAERSAPCPPSRRKCRAHRGRVQGKRSFRMVTPVQFDAMDAHRLASCCAAQTQDRDQDKESNQISVLDQWIASRSMLGANPLTHRSNSAQRAHPVTGTGLVLDKRAMPGSVGRTRAGGGAPRHRRERLY